MKAIKAILSAAATLLALGTLVFTGMFLWSFLPRAEAQPDKLDTQKFLSELEEEAAMMEAAMAESVPEPEPETEPEPEPESELVLELQGEPQPPLLSLYETQAQTWVASMTLEEKVWQLFVVTPEELTGYDHVTRAGDATKEAVEAKPVGGVCYFASNLEDRQQVQTLLGNIQSYSKTKLFLAVDEEGGLVSRVGSHEALGATRFEAAAEYGCRADMAEVYNVGKTMAQELGELGFNLNFAPVADVATNPLNTEIGSRSYSSDPQVAGAMVSAMVDGLQLGRMVSCLKHFPGHGSTQTDSHQDRSVSDRTLDELRQTEWIPFRQGIEKGAAFVMLSHLTNENLSELPASMSSEVVGYLRGELGFTGVIITDSHEMGAITNYYTSGEAAVLALQAGVDMILMPEDLQAAFDAVMEAVSQGILTEARIDESVTRVLSVKYQFGIMEDGDS